MTLCLSLLAHAQQNSKPKQLHGMLLSDAIFVSWENNNNNNSGTPWVFQRLHMFVKD